MAQERFSWIAFTQRGAALMETLRSALGGEGAFSRQEADFSLHRWTEARFSQREALFFVGAVGIAVRAVAPFVKSKATDPAVVVVDEAGHFVIPLLSGHLGGANALAKEVAALCGGTPVITTATDLNARFAVDLWAKRHGLAVLQPDRIKLVSGKLLAGETVRLYSPWPISGPCPAGVLRTEERDGADVIVDIHPAPGKGLQLVPRLCSLGLGCRRGVSQREIEAVFALFCRERDLLPEAIRDAASIDRKADEAGLLAFCRDRGWAIRFFSAEALHAAPGSFTPSIFVRETVGVDNVCERSAVLASGGRLIEKKYAADGVTLALAGKTPRLDWSW